MLTKAQFVVLAQELKGAAYAANLAAQDYAAVADQLNIRASIPNPIAQSNRPKLIGWPTFIDLLTPADVIKVYSYNELSVDLKAALARNDRSFALSIWRGLKTVLVQASITAVEAEYGKNEKNPDWSATILGDSRAMQLGLPVIRAADVQVAANGFGG